jgi:class 3 adenylate cyclase/streptogramin lyase
MIPHVTEVTSATATFLFTDIEGSTELLKTHRSEYASILADHHRILRDAFSAYGGREVDNQGDSFFVAFPRARNAVLAAATIQRSMTEHAWSGGAAVHVRMGIHTGEADVAADRYVGMSVHRAARISSVGHGGQVLVSPTTAGHLEDEDDLPGVALRDLGEHRLKNISRPVRLHQLDIDGLPRVFPPLSSEPREPSRRRRTALAGAIVVALAAAAAVALWSTRDPLPPTVVPNSVVRIDPLTLEPTQVVPVGDAPEFVLAAGGFVWVMHYIFLGTDDLRSAGDRTLTRVDPSTGEAVVVGGGLAPCGLTADPSGDVWVANCYEDRTGVRSNLVRVDAETLRFEATWPMSSLDPSTNLRTLAHGDGALWVATVTRQVERIDAVTGDRQRLPVGREVSFLAWAEGYGDLFLFETPRAWRLETATGDVQTISVDVPDGIPVVDGDTVWLPNIRAPEIVRMNAVGSPDPRSIPLPVTKTEVSRSWEAAGVSTLAVGAGAVWAVTPGDRAIWRIGSSAGDVTRIPVPHLPFGVAADNEAVWVTVADADD